MLLIGQLFDRVAIDLVGPIAPAVNKKTQIYLDLGGLYATRNRQLVPLKNIDTETVIETLLENGHDCWVGVQKEVLNDPETKLTSEYMKEVSRLLSIKRLTTTPYHSVCNRLVEKFNGTLKQMLRRLFHEQLRQWHHFIKLVLFAAYRVVQQENSGISHFDMRKGRTIRCSVSILKQLRSKQEDLSGGYYRLSVCS